ncbi:hypothetical protein VTO73DRAFT_7262 [Trametes versicolor]
MNREELSNLTRAEMQKLARRDNLNAKGTKETMIDALIEKHDPFPVPPLDAIPPATGQQAPPSARRVHGRQGRLHLASEPIAVRRSARRAANDPTQAASTRTTRSAGSSTQDTASNSGGNTAEEREYFLLFESVPEDFVACAELGGWFDMSAFGAWAVPTAIECEFRELDELKTNVQCEIVDDPLWSQYMDRWFDTSLPSSSAGSPEPYSPSIRGRDYQVGPQPSLAQFGGLSEELKAEVRRSMRH